MRMACLIHYTTYMCTVYARKEIQQVEYYWDSIYSFILLSVIFYSFSFLFLFLCNPTTDLCFFSFNLKSYLFAYSSTILFWKMCVCAFFCCCSCFCLCYLFDFICFILLIFLNIRFFFFSYVFFCFDCSVCVFCYKSCYIFNCF